MIVLVGTDIIGEFVSQGFVSWCAFAGIAVFFLYIMLKKYGLA